AHLDVLRLLLREAGGGDLDLHQSGLGGQAELALGVVHVAADCFPLAIGAPGPYPKAGDRLAVGGLDPPLQHALGGEQDGDPVAGGDAAKFAAAVAYAVGREVVGQAAVQAAEPELSLGVGVHAARLPRGPGQEGGNFFAVSVQLVAAELRRLQVQVAAAGGDCSAGDRLAVRGD